MPSKGEKRAMKSGENEKLLVKVRADFLLDGRVRPLRFRPENGEAAVIDSILDVRPAPSLKAGGQGIRYTCHVGERILYLFHDRDQWFLEAQTPEGG